MSQLVSIVVPCFNQSQYLPKTLQSVLNQTYSNWECIIVNDGSPDHTEEVALEWCEKDQRFIYLKKENGGLSSARNAGLEVASGTWIQFLDSDDLLLQDKLEESSNYFEEGYDLIVTDFQLLSENQLLPAFCKIGDYDLNQENVVLHWDSGINIPIHSALFYRPSIDQIRFDTNLKSKEDWYFWIQFFAIKRKSIFLPIRSAIYRVNPNTVGTNLELIQFANDYIYDSLDQNVKKMMFDKLNLKNVKLQYRIKDLQEQIVYYQNNRYIRFSIAIHKILNKILK